ncbi:MAG: hypothetical protein ACE5F9_00730 [Phycisphaerae bacterium]
MTEHLNPRQVADWLSAGEQSRRPHPDPAVTGHLRRCPACRALVVRAAKALDLAAATRHKKPSGGHPACPADLRLAAYLEDRLSPAERAATAAHLADCCRCRQVIGASVQTDPAVRPDLWQHTHRWIFVHRRALVAASVFLAAGLGLVTSHFFGERVEAANPVATPDWIYQAQWLMRSGGGPETALSVIEDGLKQHPDLVRGILLKAKLLLALNRLSEVENIARRLIRKTDVAWAGHTLMAAIRTQEGDAAAGRKHAELAKRLSPHPSDAAFRESLFQKAILQGEAHEQIAILDQILATTEDDRDARYLRACRHRDLALHDPIEGCSADHAKAMLHDAQTLVARFPRWPHAWATRAEANRIRREYSLAVEDCNTAIRLEPGAAVLLIRGECLRHLNRADPALRDFYRVFNLHPSRRQIADAYVDLALAYRDALNYREAFRELSHVIDRHPLGAGDQALVYKGVLRLLRLDVYPAGRNKAREDFRAALELAPKNAYAGLLLWRILREQGDDEEAARVIAEALAAAPGHRPVSRDHRECDWSTLLLQYYTGTLAREDLIAEARSTWQHAEASYYIGEKVLHDAGPAAARVWFQRCIATGIRHTNEYHLARARLAPSAPPPFPPKDLSAAPIDVLETETW